MWQNKTRLEASKSRTRITKVGFNTKFYLAMVKAFGASLKEVMIKNHSNQDFKLGARKGRRTSREVY